MNGTMPHGGDGASSGPGAAPASATNALLPERCPVCGNAALQELRCKVICTNCRTILQSCADL